MAYDIVIKNGNVIDADGLTVSPGFIDVHTHFDPHWWWNPLGTASCWHGVTTVVTGNCGLTLAPCKPQHRETVAGIFSQVEEVSMTTLDAILPWDWESFGEYMERLDGHTGINIVPLLGHSAIRVYAMGQAAMERAATAEGIHHCIVNGRVILNHNQETGELPGAVLRSSAYTGANGRG